MHATSDLDRRVALLERVLRRRRFTSGLAVATLTVLCLAAFATAAPQSPVELRAERFTVVDADGRGRISFGYLSPERSGIVVNDASGELTIGLDVSTVSMALLLPGPGDEPKRIEMSWEELGSALEIVGQSTNETLLAAKVGKAKADIMAIANALDQFVINNNGRFPDELEWLVLKDTSGRSYLEREELPRDPWGRAYLYEQPGPGTNMPEVYTLGRDGKRGGDGEDADILFSKIVRGR